MKLRDKYFDQIIEGTKRIELRLNDEKRKQINLGDTIIFSNSIGHQFVVYVIGLNRYTSFYELVQDFDIELLADKSTTKEELLKTLYEIYSDEDQESFGVVGIRVEFL